MASWRGKRSWRKSPYHYDMRYGTREHLSDMDWQRGVLSKEQDTMLIGEREANVIKALAKPTEELQPDKKLQQPLNSSNSDDIIFTI